MPAKYLLDTSVYSQPLRRSPVRAALEKWQGVGDGNCCISIVCKAEVEWGLLKSPNVKRDQIYQHLLVDRLDVLPTDTRTWELFSRIKARQIQIGQPVGDLDLLIATNAIQHNLTLATLNAGDFKRIENLKWEDWSH